MVVIVIIMGGVFFIFVKKVDYLYGVCYYLKVKGNVYDMYEY